MSKIDLLCFPFAGGSKYSYVEFNKWRPGNLNIKCFDYPGRGSRMQEPLVPDVHELAEDALTQVKPFVGNAYALYGHSMGALVVYLLLHKLADGGFPLPRHVFITGAPGPSAKKKEKKHLLEKQAFKAELKKYDGCPHEVLENDVLFSFIDGVLRADFKAVENYIHTSRRGLWHDRIRQLHFTCIQHETRSRSASGNGWIIKEETSDRAGKDQPGHCISQ